MADPKYANLPGIDLGSPDVYETSELPEDDQNDKSVGDLNSESVDILTVDTKQAYDRFRGKTVDADGIDFSDKISQSRRTGYIAQTEYELLEEGSAIKETPQQKYQRLQHEIRDLSEEVGKIKENVKDAASTEKLSPVNLGKQLEYINHQLSDLHLEKLLGPEGSVDISDPQGALKQRLLTQLIAYKPLDSQAGKGKEKTGAGDHVTYQLHYKPEQAQFSKNARVANLDERLERLEAVIGTNVEKMVRNYT